MILQIQDSYHSFSTNTFTIGGEDITIGDVAIVYGTPTDPTLIQTISLAIQNCLHHNYAELVQIIGGIYKTDMLVKLTNINKIVKNKTLGNIVKLTNSIKLVKTTKKDNIVMVGSDDA